MLFKATCWSVALWLGVVVSGMAQDRPAMASTPAWVVADETVGAGTRKDGSGGLYYEVVSDQVDLTGDMPVWHRHIGYTVVRERGLSEAGNISIGYQPDYQTLVLNQLDVLREGKRVDMRDRAHYARLRREQDLDAGLLDGESTLNVTVPDLRVGDRLDYSFSVVGKNPIFGDAYYDTYGARFDVPVGFRRVRVHYPHAQPLYWKVSTDHFNVARKQEGDTATLDITASQLEAVRVPENTPEGYDSYGRISLSTVGDWRAVVDWAAPLYPRRFIDHDAAKAIARQLALDPAHPESSLLRAVAFVQGQIRYTGLDMGANSHVPHAPEDTLRNRYGDCKDKATLLIALLDLAGVRAEPVLVNTRPGYELAKALPGANVFNHVVVLAHLPAGEVWVDATRDRENGTLAERRALPFRIGLPLVPGASALAEIPYLVPTQPQIEVTEQLDLKEHKAGYSSVFNVVTVYRQGQGEDMRERFRVDGAQEQGRLYLRYMRGFYKDLKAKGDPSVEDAGNAQVVTREGYTLDWAKTEGSALDVWLFQLNDWMKEIPADARNTPRAPEGPRLARQRVEVRLDRGIAIPEKRTEVSNPWFRFVLTEHVEGQRLILTGEWTRLATQIPASGIEQASMDMQVARDLLAFPLDLDPDTVLGSTEWRDWRWPLAALACVLVLILACIPLRSGRSLAAMMFAPGATAAALPGHPWTRRSAWGAYLLVAFVYLLAERLKPDDPEMPWMVLALAVGALFGGWIRLLIFASLLRLALGWLKLRIAFEALTATLAATSFPMAVFTVGALVAVQGHIGWLQDGFQAKSAELPGIIVSGALSLTGILWTAVTSVCAIAGATGSSRRRALAASAISVSIMLILVGLLFGAITLLRTATTVAGGAS